MNEFDRHLDHLPYNEYTINKKNYKNIEDIEDMVIKKIQKENLHNAISLLTQKQKERIYSYFFEGLTQKEISIRDNCSIRAVQYSLKNALKNLKKYLNKTS